MTLPFINNAVWLRAHREQYVGKWVALFDGKVIYSSEGRQELQDFIKSRRDLPEILVVFVCE